MTTLSTDRPGRTGSATAPVGSLLRDWRRRRRLSQLDLGIQAGVSARHVSFVETGRSRPSRDMVLHLADELDVPLRERNQLLLAAGFAPSYVGRSLDDPEMRAACAGVDQVLRAYEPYPALVIDRGWNMLASNSGIGALVEGVAPELLEPPVNVLRLSLHPDGLSSRIVNLSQWRWHVLGRLAREATVTGSAELAALHRELVDYPGGLAHHGPDEGVAVPLRMRVGDAELAFISTVTTFGTAVDLTLAELSIEAFLPADAATAEALRGGRT